MAAITAEVAGRLATALGDLPGTRTVVICGDDGSLLASMGHAPAAQAVALVRFLSARATALTTNGDLRGLGRVIGESHFQGLMFAGQGEEGTLMSCPGGHVFTTFERGTSAESAGPRLLATVQRYTRSTTQAGARPAGDS